jgi:hypothetical protein
MYSFFGSVVRIDDERLECEQSFGTANAPRPQAVFVEATHFGFSQFPQLIVIARFVYEHVRRRISRDANHATSGRQRAGAVLVVRMTCTFV